MSNLENTLGHYPVIGGLVSIGQLYTDDSYFNPITDNDDNWVISVEEMKYCTNEKFAWVAELPIIEYKPKQSEPLI